MSIICIAPGPIGLDCASFRWIPSHCSSRMHLYIVPVPQWGEIHLLMESSQWLEENDAM